MTKKIVLSFTLLVTGLLGFSQENTSSPYSYYGLGDVRFRGTHDARAMGGLNITGDSINLNLLNPGSYSRLKLVSFVVGGTSTFANLKNTTTSEKATRTSLDYLAIGVPIGKFGASFGVIPYSAIGYKIQSSAIDENLLQRNRQFIGDGNINKIYLGTAYSFSKEISAGINLEYNFGSVNNIFRESITDLNENSNIQLGTRELNNAQISGLSWNFGLLYDTKITSKMKLYTSFTFRPEASLNLEKTRNLATVNFSINGIELIANSVDIDVPDSKLTVPSRFSLGTGIGETNKWLLGAELTLTNTKKQNNIFGTNEDLTFKNSQKFTLGGYYIPKYDSFSSYFSRIIYRGGFRYESSGLEIKNESINDYGMNFGLGLPVGLSKIDIGFEFGKRGTIKQNLIQENYFSLSVGLSLSDKWFKKTLID